MLRVRSPNPSNLKISNLNNTTPWRVAVKSLTFSTTEKEIMLRMLQEPQIRRAFGGIIQNKIVSRLWWILPQGGIDTIDVTAVAIVMLLLPLRRSRSGTMGDNAPTIRP